MNGQGGCPHARISVIRKAHLTSGLWLGLFAMLMIHVGPLYSASRLTSSIAAPIAQSSHHAHAQAGHQPQRANAAEPAWLSALDLCGYCELLTLSPALVLTVQMAMPYYAPSYARLRPQRPLPPAPRGGAGYPRAPPAVHS
nr:DUF2946 domain-containing protein [Pseudomonas sp. KSR10]